MGDLEDVAPKHLEGHEVADLDILSNGKSRPPLIEADNAFDVLQLDQLGAAGVRLEDDRPRGGAKVLKEAYWDWDNKVGWSDVVMEMANLQSPPLGQFADLPSPAVMLEVPSPKIMPVPPIIILENCKKNK
jgi:hypothetical protein